MREVEVSMVHPESLNEPNVPAVKVEPRIFIGIDPGSVRTGICAVRYDEVTRKANVFFMRILNSDEVNEFINSLDTELSFTLVMEMFRNAMATGNFRGRNSANLTKAEADTLKLCKILKVAAESYGHTMVTQEPSILAMGKKWCPVPIPKGHLPDDISALIHVLHHMMKMLLIDGPKDVIFYGQDSIEVDADMNRANTEDGDVT